MRYVRDFNHDEETEKRKKHSRLGKIFISIILLIVAFYVFIFPSDIYEEYSTYGKHVVAVNSITKIAYCVEFEFKREIIDGEMVAYYDAVDRNVLKMEKDFLLGVEVYCCEDVVLVVEDTVDDSEFTLGEIFKYAVFGKGKLKK